MILVNDFAFSEASLQGVGIVILSKMNFFEEAVAQGSFDKDRVQHFEMI